MHLGTDASNMYSRIHVFVRSLCLYSWIDLNNYFASSFVRSCFNSFNRSSIFSFNTTVNIKWEDSIHVAYNKASNRVTDEQKKLSLVFFKSQLNAHVACLREHSIDFKSLTQRSKIVKSYIFNLNHKLTITGRI